MLEYSMTALLLPKATWEDIIKKIINTKLLKTGLYRTFSRALIYTPKEVNGLNTNHLYYWQILKQIQALVKYYRRKTTTGKLIRAIWEGIVQQAGLNQLQKIWNWGVVRKYLTKST